MSDEKNSIPLNEDESGAVRWQGPTDRSWPRALGPRDGEDPSPEAESSQPEGDLPPTIVELSPDEFQALAAGETAESTTGKADPKTGLPGTEPTGNLAEEPAAKTPKHGSEPDAAKKKPEKKAVKKKPVKRKIGPAPKKKRKEISQPEPDPWEAERNYRPIRTRRDGRIGCLGGLMYALFIISLSTVLAVFLWMSASDVLALNKPAGSVEVTLPAEIFSNKKEDVTDSEGNVTGMRTVRAADINSVASILKDAGLINYKWLFRLYSSFSHAERKVDPGTYVLSTNLDYRAMVTKMRAGADSQLQTLVMFPEGFNQDQIFARLEENGVCSAEELYAAAADTEYAYAFLEDAEPGDPYRLEGFLFPDTYYFYQGMQAASAINKFLSNMHYHITEEMWQKANALNLSFRQVITVASLIEREAANDDERALIASVIYNRLKADMPLQVDSTVVYARRETGESRVSPEIIQETDSPYNTYLYKGLPPGPICSPGMKSIEAALNPAASKYMYFALEVETHTVRFFVNYNEFEVFVAAQDYG